ncbi:TonB-dependent receptor [Balneolales bacterium ANBcel1]|nr:TonB-dependent receptor [Balneolales bacterium ANBcel1]
MSVLLTLCLALLPLLSHQGGATGALASADSSIPSTGHTSSTKMEFGHTQLFETDGVPPQAVIRGTVTDSGGEPMPGVNIYLRNTYTGTTSDENGRFRFSTTATGEHILVFQFLGFNSVEKPVSLPPDQTLDSASPDIRVDAVMRESVTWMSAVTITAGTMEASEESRAVVLRPLDIVTTPSAMGDLTTAFQTLPGTSTSGSDGRLFVRGGDATETGIYMDGLRIGNAYGTTPHNVPTRTRFDPYLFRGSFFSTGGFSAEYDQALSSVLVLHSVDEPLRTQTDAGLLSVGGSLRHTQTGSRSSLIASANYTDLTPFHRVIPQNLEWDRSPFSRDFSLAARHKPSSLTLLKGYVHHESGGLSLWDRDGAHGPASSGFDHLRIDNSYTYTQFAFRRAGTGRVIRGGLSASLNNDTFVFSAAENGAGVMELGVRQQQLHGKVVADHQVADRMLLKTGAEAFVNRYREEILPEHMERSLSGLLGGAFAEVDYLFSNALTVRAGLRVAYSDLAGQWWLPLRFSMAWELPHGLGQVSAAAGTFHQMPDEELHVVQPDMAVSESRHLILNYQYRSTVRTFRIEAYHKEYDKLATYRGSRFRYHDIAQTGSGSARGFDVLMRDTGSFTNTDFWISYSYIDSRRQFGGYESRVQPAFAPRHNGSLVVKRFITKLQSQPGLSLTLNDGYPYTDPGQPGEMNARTRTYADLSLSWSYLPRPNIIIHVACSNVTGRNNVFGYEYIMDTSGSTQRQAVRQTAPRFFLVGLFWTFSGDKTANQLNNL